MDSSLLSVRLVRLVTNASLVRKPQVACMKLRNACCLKPFRVVASHHTYMGRLTCALVDIDVRWFEGQFLEHRIKQPANCLVIWYPNQHSVCSLHLIRTRCKCQCFKSE